MEHQQNIINHNQNLALLNIREKDLKLNFIKLKLIFMRRFSRTEKHTLINMLPKPNQTHSSINYNVPKFLPTTTSSPPIRTPSGQKTQPQSGKNPQ